MCDNVTPHILLLWLFDGYNKELWQVIKAQTPFHKPNYKFEVEKMNLKNTYYSEIVHGGKNWYVDNIYSKQDFPLLNTLSCDYFTLLLDTSYNETEVLET